MPPVPDWIPASGLEATEVSEHLAVIFSRDWGWNFATTVSGSTTSQPSTNAGEAVSDDYYSTAND